MTPGCDYTKELERVYFRKSKQDIDIPVFDPTSGLEDLESKIELVHSEEVDKAMEIWAQQRTGHQKVPTIQYSLPVYIHMMYVIQ